MITSVTEEIKSRVLGTFSPWHFELINESEKHRGHVGDNGTGESHFQLIVVDDVFGQHSRVARQRLVFEVLNDLMNSKIHALSLELYTVDEYQKKKTTRSG